MPHPRNAGWRRGDHWVCCDVCGFEYRASQIRIRWDGMAVCPQDYEERHPQDFLRARKDDPRVWPVRSPSAQTIDYLSCPTLLFPRVDDTLGQLSEVEFSWAAVNAADFYFVYLWIDGETEPTTPAVITQSTAIRIAVEENEFYNWYVSVSGLAGETPTCSTNVHQFSTHPFLLANEGGAVLGANETQPGLLQVE